MNTGQLKGHLCALTTVLIWGTTFISSKILLIDLSSLELMLLRFTLALLALLIIHPKPMGNTTMKQELTFAAAGLCGVTLYFLMENTALSLTMTPNVSVIVSLSPFFLALFARIFLKENTLSPQFFLGFAVSIAGVVLLSFHGEALELDPAGDLTALGSAAVWAAYSLIVKRINGFGYHIIQTTRRIFFYGILFLLPVLFATGGFSVTGAVLAKPQVLGNLLYLGLGASALGYVTWNWAVKDLGPLKTSGYIYLIPMVTVLASALLMPEEHLTWLSGAGILLTLAGLILSERKDFSKKKGT